MAAPTNTYLQETEWWRRRGLAHPRGKDEQFKDWVQRLWDDEMETYMGNFAYPDGTGFTDVQDQVLTGLQAADTENDRARSQAAAPPAPKLHEFIVVMDTGEPQPEALRVMAPDAQKAREYASHWFSNRNILGVRFIDVFNAETMPKLEPGTGEIKIEIDRTAGTDADDWFVVRGGPPGDDKPYTAYSIEEARAIRRDRQGKATALGYTVVHVDSYVREKNGRTEDVREHNRRQLVRGGDRDPTFQPLRRRRK